MGICRMIKSRKKLLPWTNARRAETVPAQIFASWSERNVKASKGQKEEKKSEGKREKNKKQIPSQKSTDKTDHGGAATAVVGIHAESHDARRRLVFLQTHGSLATRTTDDIEIGINSARVCGRGGNLFCAAGRLRLDLDRGRAHCCSCTVVFFGRDRLKDVEVVVVVVMNGTRGRIRRTKQVVSERKGFSRQSEENVFLCVVDSEF